MEQIFNNHINKEYSFLKFDNNFLDENKTIIINEIENNLKINDNVINNYKEIFKMKIEGIFSKTI